MLISKPTKYGSGLTLYGDYWDLENLHETIHYLMEKSPLQEKHKHFVLGLAYDVRKAYENAYKKEIFGFDERSQVTYYGADILWPIFLSQLSLLRSSAAYVPTTNEHQSNLFRLETCAEEALLEFDLQAGKACFDWFKIISNVLDSLLIEFVSDCTRRYVTETTPGKSRFKKLPKYLKMINPYSDEYKAFEEEILMIAQEKNVPPEELSDSREWPDIKW